MNERATNFTNPTINWRMPTFLVVTGASRGLGETIAKEFSKKLCEGSCVVLLARNKTKLEAVKADIKKISPVFVENEAMDLNLLDAPSYEHFFSKYLHYNFHQVVIVNNAGTLGDTSKTTVQNTSGSEIKSYFDVNLFSAIFITTGFLNAFKAAERKVVINISSLAALQPFRGWSLYCTGKAAREMYFRTLALEEKDSVNVLNYAPGPLLTDMLPQILRDSLPEIKQQFQDAQMSNQLLTTDYTVQRLLGVLERGRFKSGDHVDVYDMNY
ncbi:sepiapterin reductase [Caerostris darwini]|uniref:Sepiapterin reductase n=1 Tax=Caerostris darwini TaxID=1538125 RepID=A0AAV4N8H2_9ARAC|nr:sepiapterin reductase [Caerostris darwini]